VEELSKYLHPANAEELGNIADEVGAEVLRGALRYPSNSGGWQSGELDLSEHLARYRDHELMVIIAPIGRASEVDRTRYICGICGFAMTELGECPRCKMQDREDAEGLRRRQKRQQVLKEVGQIVDELWEEGDDKRPASDIGA